MKKLVLCISALAILACKQEPKDYVTFSGKITDQNSDSLTVIKRGVYSKTIKVNADGTFSDTLKVKTGVYTIFDGAESSSVYLKNGFDISMDLDTSLFDESIKFTGNGSENSNYLAKKALFEEKAFAPNLFSLEENAFHSEITEITKKYKALLENNKTLDSTLLASETKAIDNFESEIFGYYKKQKEALKAKEAANAKFVGKPSPTFENYENAKGGKTSLSDLKGKYVYVDVWATWCGPCKAEIPFLKEVEKEFHGKNIEFVSISVDDGRGYKGSAEKAKEGWKKMVAEKELGGIQIFADNGWKSKFIAEYEIRGIPRFILIDPAGNMLNVDAPRPSDPKLKELFKSLNI